LSNLIKGGVKKIRSKQKAICHILLPTKSIFISNRKRLTAHDEVCDVKKLVMLIKWKI